MLYANEDSYYEIVQVSYNSETTIDTAWNEDEAVEIAKKYAETAPQGVSIVVYEYAFSGTVFESEGTK